MGYGNGSVRRVLEVGRDAGRKDACSMDFFVTGAAERKFEETWSELHESTLRST